MTTLSEGQRVGSYRIVRLLGQGGMGAVYEARQDPLDRRVALKTLHPDYARNEESVLRFFNEAKVLSRLEHPSIVQVSDFGRSDDGVAFLVMEFLRGQSLSRRIEEHAARGERMNTVSVLQVGWQMADVLAVAHAEGIVHRDIKPDNLMLVADPVAPSGERVKILDFGIAKLTRPEDRGVLKTDTQAVMGTPLYMSPEQCAGAGGVDAKSDVYSLGCVLYEALAGRPPFIAEGAGRLIGMHLYQQPPALSSLAPRLPPGVAELVQRMLIKDKAQRPSMDQVADELGRLLSKVSGAGPVVRSRLPSQADPNATRAVAWADALSTLGQSLGQSGRHRLRNRAMLFAVVLVLCLPAILWMRSSSPDRSAVAKVPVATTASLPTPSRGSIVWKLSSDPQGAQVFDERDTLLGTTPLTLTRPVGTGQMTLRIHRDGYSDERVVLQRERNQAEHVTLAHKSPTGKRAVQARPAVTAAKPAGAAIKTVSSPGKPGAVNPPEAESKPAAPAVQKAGRIGYED